MTRFIVVGAWVQGYPVPLVVVTVPAGDWPPVEHVVEPVWSARTPAEVPPPAQGWVRRVEAADSEAAVVRAVNDALLRRDLTARVRQ